MEPDSALHMPSWMAAHGRGCVKTCVFLTPMGQRTTLAVRLSELNNLMPTLVWL
jgi:hypothetical protein